MNDDLDILTNLSLFSGVGGLDLGGKWTGRIKTVCYVEKDPYAQAVLMSRIRDGRLDDAPIWDDVTTFDGKEWRGKADIISGGFPCPDLSVAGRRAGIVEGTRSGLWFHFARIICEVQPLFVLVENVPGLLSSKCGGLGIVLRSLAEMGYDAKWRVISAVEVGAPHLRKRVWIVANARQKLRGSWWDGQMDWKKTQWSLSAEKPERCGEDVADFKNTNGRGTGKEKYSRRGYREVRGCSLDGTRLSDGATQPGLGGTPDGLAERLDDPGRYGKEVVWRATPSWEEGTPRIGKGIPHRTDRLKCIGNGVVPLQSIPAWKEIIRMYDAEKELQDILG